MMQKNLLKYEFSKQVLEYLEPPKNVWQELIHSLFYKQAEERPDPLLEPTTVDMDAILSSTPEIDSYCLEQTAFRDGIFYMQYKVVIKATSLNTTAPSEVAQRILTKMRHYWQVNRTRDCAPFITLLTSKQLILAQPVSIQGLRTLAKIQHEQLAFQRQQLEERANRQIRIAREKRASSQSTEQ